MTLEKQLVLTCNGCRATEEYDLSIRRHRTMKSILKNVGFTRESAGLFSGTNHYCPDCNDREKDKYHVYDGRGDAYLGSVKAWEIVDARREAWDTFERENMVKREKMVR